MILLLEANLNRPLIALFMILTAAVMIAIICNMHKWFK